MGPLYARFGYLLGDYGFEARPSSFVKSPDVGVLGGGGNSGGACRRAV